MISDTYLRPHLCGMENTIKELIKNYDSNDERLFSAYQEMLEKEIKWLRALTNQQPTEVNDDNDVN